MCISEHNRDRDGVVSLQTWLHKSHGAIRTQQLQDRLCTQDAGLHNFQSVLLDATVDKPLLFTDLNVIVNMINSYMLLIIRIYSNMIR